MIAVAANAEDLPVIAEFFELFKTPWQPFRPGCQAEILLCAQPEVPANAAKLLLLYAGAETAFDRTHRLLVQAAPAGILLKHGGEALPIYGRCLRLPPTAEPVLHRIRSQVQSVVRLGYDLFAEVRYLLANGQPPEQAANPTLEIHIALLRELIISHGLPLVEIPPVPAGSKFITCLTHDVDHVGIRNHRLDHTLLGFLYRATAGSVREVWRGRKTVRQLAVNWLAVLKLPGVHVGLAKDFWYQFEQYTALEAGRPSTFFVIPKKGETGLDARGNRPPKRAASYQATELKPELDRLQAAGKEIGVHGLDAWRAAAAGEDEKQIMARLTGAGELGVRMHWLYFDARSPVELERAGFVYDSTVGYNGTIGYRAGTTQVYKPLTVARLLELPMHVMDTALFYPSYLNLSPAQADEKIRPLIATAGRHGGVLTVNWHDRSIAPERQWDGTYRRLLADCEAAGAWFATAAQTVGWFQKRRQAEFTVTPGGQLKIQAAPGAATLPALRVRLTRGAEVIEKLLSDGSELSLAV